MTQTLIENNDIIAISRGGDILSEASHAIWRILSPFHQHLKTVR